MSSYIAILGLLIVLISLWLAMYYFVTDIEKFIVIVLGFFTGIKLIMEGWRRIRYY